MKLTKFALPLCLLAGAASAQVGQVVTWKQWIGGAGEYVLPADPQTLWTKTGFPANNTFIKTRSDTALDCRGAFDVWTEHPQDSLGMGIWVDGPLSWPYPKGIQQNLGMSGYFVTFYMGHVITGVPAGIHTVDVVMVSNFGLEGHFNAQAAFLQCFEVMLPPPQ